jgi:hypothetical protein
VGSWSERVGRAVTIDQSEQHDKYKAALEQIVKQKRTPRAYRHTKFEQLIKIAEHALAQEAV